METLTIDLPEGAFFALHRSPIEFAKEMRLAAAIHWYQQAEISQEKAAEIAGLSRIDFLGELARRKVDVFVLDMDDLDRELARG